MIHKLNFLNSKKNAQQHTSPFETFDNATPKGAIFQAQKIVKTYHHNRTGEVVVFDNYNMEIQQGEMIAIVGASGAGKSTLMHMLGSLESPTAGTITYKGRQLNTLNKQELAHMRGKEVGFVFQSHFLLNELSASENVMMPMMIQGKEHDEAKNKAYNLLATMGLANREEHYPLELSGGEQQRVAIARAMANNPAVLLADEPTGNLDNENSEMIMNIFHNLNRQGVTIVVVTHSASVAKQCSRVETIHSRQAQPLGG